MIKHPTTITNADGDEVDLPMKWTICPTCGGEGVSSAYLGAFTREDFYEQGPDFLEEYLSGRYDRQCDECGGTGKVQIVDEDRLTEELKAGFDAWLEDEISYRNISRMERLMEGGDW